MTIEEYPQPEHKSAVSIFFSKLLRLIFRIFLVVLTGTVLGAAIYFGVRSFYRQAVLLPAQSNLTKLDDLTQRQAQAEKQTAKEIGDLQARISLLEKIRKQDAEQISSLQAEVTSLSGELEKNQAVLAQIDSVQGTLKKLEEQASESDKTIASFLSSSGGPVSELKREIQLLRVMELLNRCRLYLSQNNYGLAAQDAGVVRQILMDMKSSSPVESQAVLAIWIERLDLALSNLTVAPVLAGEDLEMVWRMVLVGLPQQAGTTPVSATVTPPTQVSPVTASTETTVTPSLTPVKTSVTPTPTPN
jgi:hypothetical protein